MAARVTSRRAATEGLFTAAGRLTPEMARFAAWLETSPDVADQDLAEALRAESTTAIAAVGLDVVRRRLAVWRRQR